MTESIFIDVGLVLAIAIGVSFIVQLCRQPLIIAYIITGIVSGPLFLDLINANHEFFEVFAKIGVVLLLFLVGLSLNIDYLRQIGKPAAITGIGQVVFTTFFGFLILALFGFSRTAALYLAVSITFSSTIIIMKLLSDKREQNTAYGRYTIGLMLVQDIIAIILMILLFSANSGQSLPLSLLYLAVKIIILVALVYSLSRALLPLILERVAQNSEFLLIFTMAWCFAVAGLAALAGLTLEVGAVIAGLSLGSSSYRTEISSRIKPIRDFFIALFFIILGSELNMADFQASFIPGMALSAFVLVGNPLILYILYRLLRFTRQTSFLAGLTAAQVSEFGFVFLFVANELGFVGGEIMSIFTIVALVTIFASSYLITYNHQIYRRLLPVLELFGPDKRQEKTESAAAYDVLVFGYHRLGWKICDALKEMGVSFAVVDFDPMAAKKLRQREIPFFFGDATEVDFLCELPLDSAKMVISTLPRAEDQLALIGHIRLTNQNTLLIANLAHSKFLEDLYAAGADYIMMPHLLSGQWMGNLLKANNWDRRIFRDLTRKQKEELKLRFTLGAGERKSEA